jgi:hypothetical protein
MVIPDDATSEIYYAQLVEEESTWTVMARLGVVTETHGLFCALYSDRESHFFLTVKEGEKVDKHRLTQVGRVMKERGPDDYRVFTAGAGQVRTKLRDLARVPAAGVAVGRSHRDRRSQSVSARAVHRRV